MMNTVHLIKKLNLYAEYNKRENIHTKKNFFHPSNMCVCVLKIESKERKF